MEKIQHSGYKFQVSNIEKNMQQLVELWQTINTA